VHLVGFIIKEYTVYIKEYTVYINVQLVLIVLFKYQLLHIQCTS